MSFFSPSPIEFSLCCPCIPGCVAFPWSVIDLPGAMLLKQMDSPLSEAVNYKQDLGWGAGGLHIHFSSCWDLVGLDLALDLGYAV